MSGCLTADSSVGHTILHVYFGSKQRGDTRVRAKPDFYSCSKLLGLNVQSVWWARRCSDTSTANACTYDRVHTAKRCAAAQQHAVCWVGCLA